MKRFLLFAGEYYYPRENGKDFVSAHDSIAEAMAVEPRTTSDRGSGFAFPWDWHWACIFDVEQLKCVRWYSNGNRAYDKQVAGWTDKEPR